MGAALLVWFCAGPAAAAEGAAAAGPAMFDTPERAADALIQAAEKFDVAALLRLMGPQGKDIVLSGDFVQDRARAEEFAAHARQKKRVVLEPKTGRRATLIVGNDDWPSPVPIVKRDDKWFFDAPAGRKEIFYRRIGSNELDAIRICRGYVEAQA